MFQQEYIPASIMTPDVPPRLGKDSGLASLGMEALLGKELSCSVFDQYRCSDGIRIARLIIEDHGLYPVVTNIAGGEERRWATDERQIRQYLLKWMKGGEL